MALNLTGVSHPNGHRVHVDKAMKVAEGHQGKTVQGADGAVAALAKISQETLAEMVGTTRARVSFFMNRFRKLGFINYDGKLEVHNSLLNVVLHDNPHLRARTDTKPARTPKEARPKGT